MPVKIPKSVLRARRKRPKFVRQESWRYVRLETTYRRPRGKDMQDASSEEAARRHL
jgi:large subunit ribosomal protein L32e